MSTDDFSLQNTDDFSFQDTNDSGYSAAEVVNFLPAETKHRNVLKLLFPIELGGDFDTDIEIEGAHLDAVQANAEILLAEIHPDTTVKLLSRWEEIYGLAVNELTPEYLRRQSLMAKINTDIGISAAALQKAIKRIIGYEPVVENYHVPRCDDPFTLTDHERFAFDDNLVYQITVNIDNGLVTEPGYSKAVVQLTINDIIPAYAIGILDTGEYGFFCDDSGSLTDLTLIAI